MEYLRIKPLDVLQRVESLQIPTKYKLKKLGEDDTRSSTLVFPNEYQSRMELDVRVLDLEAYLMNNVIVQYLVIIAENALDIVEDYADTFHFIVGQKRSFEFNFNRQLPKTNVQTGIASKGNPVVAFNFLLALIGRKVAVVLLEILFT